VYGKSQSGVGVYASSASWGLPAIVGRGYGGAAGVLGYSGASDPVDTAPLDTGVYGYATGYEQRPAAEAIGVYGRATQGTAVYAHADPAGTALRVNGRASFSRSGLVSVSAGRTSVSKTVAGMTSSSLVFAVVKTGDGGAWVRKAATTTGKFTVYLNKAASTTTTVAWFALG
jgi:hypothetical protein